MAALWAAGRPLTPKQVRAELADDLARTTVTTILTRLYDKNLVTRARTREGRAFAYAPTAPDDAALGARRLHTALDRESDRHRVLARFVTTLGADDERLLRDLLADTDPTPDERGRP